MKYIILEAVPLFNDSDVVVEIPIVFPDLITHSDIAESVCRLLSHEHEMHATAVSAGFVNHKVECHGKSESLDLESRPEDSDVINYHNYTGGMKDARESLASNEEIREALRLGKGV